MKLLYGNFHHDRLRSVDFQPEELLLFPEFREFDIKQARIEYTLPRKNFKISGPIAETSPFPIVSASFLKVLEEINFHKYRQVKVELANQNEDYFFLLNDNIKINAIDLRKSKYALVKGTKKVSSFKKLILNESTIGHDDHLVNFVESPRMLFFSNILTEQIMTKYPKQQLKRIKFIDLDSNKLEIYSKSMF